MGWFHRTMVVLFCTVMILYFIPMLLFIPLFFLGGNKMTNPFVAGYHGQTADRRWEDIQPPAGHWYWDPATVVCITAGVPTSLLGAMLLYQRFNGPSKDDRH